MKMFEWVEQSKALDEYCKKVFNAVFTDDSDKYQGFHVCDDHTELCIEYNSHCYGHTYEEYWHIPVDVLEQGIDHCVAWYNNKVEEEKQEKERQAAEKKQREEALREENELKTYHRLKEKFEKTQS